MNRGIDLATLSGDQPLDIVCLSDAPWDWPLWTNRQYALSTLAILVDTVRVLYIEPPSFAYRPFNRDFHREQWPSGASVRRRSSLTLLHQAQDRVWTLHPPLPVPRHVMRKRGFLLLQWYALLLARWAMRRLDFDPALLWVYTPYGGWMIDHLPSRFVIYDCVDEHSAAPYYAWDRARIERLEQYLMRSADVVFTVSNRLQKQKSPFNAHTICVGNPVNYALFSQAQERPADRPPELAGLTGPLLGFYGVLAAYKIDLDLLHNVMVAYPGWNLVLIGTGAARVPDRLRALGNVHVLPAMPQRDLVRYVAWCDVLLMPYRVTDYTLSSRPLKLHEYFATGKPVVSTFTPSEPAYREVLYLADDVCSFARGIQAALDEDDPTKRQRRIMLAQQHTWENKVKTMVSIMKQHGLFEGFNHDG